MLNSDDAIIGKNIDGTITSWNNSAEKIYGYKAAEVLGKSIKILAPEKEKKKSPKFSKESAQASKLRIFKLNAYEKTAQKSTYHLLFHQLETIMERLLVL